MEFASQRNRHYFLAPFKTDTLGFPGQEFPRVFRAWMHGAGLAFAAAGILIFLLLLAVRGAKTRTRCPGERWTRLDVVLPWRWLRPHSCGYDLTGVPRNQAGTITCPECGRNVGSAGDLVSSPWRATARRGAVMLLLGSLVVYATPWVRSGRWAKRLPTGILMASVRAPYAVRPRAIRAELEARIDNQQLSWEQVQAMVPRWIEDLRDDREDWNGTRAMGHLAHWKELSRPGLHAALGSADWQQRQLAADLLRYDPGYAPTPELLRVIVEGLRHDDLPYEMPKHGRKYGATTWVSNATYGVSYLLEHPAGLAPYLRVGLESDDRQQRQLSAMVAGLVRCRELIHLAAPILIDSLKNNKTWDDARRSVAALHGFGDSIAPWMLPLRFSEDEQQRALALLVLRELDLLPVGFGRPDPKVLATVTSVVRLNDPCGIQTLSHHWGLISILD